jgi:hypothetical protein
VNPLKDIWERVAQPETSARICNEWLKHQQLQHENGMAAVAYVIRGPIGSNDPTGFAAMPVAECTTSRKSCSMSF